MSDCKIMVNYSGVTKLMKYTENETLGIFKQKLEQNFNISKNSILVHYGQKIFSNNDDDKLISELGMTRAIKLSINHTPAISLKYN